MTGETEVIEQYADDTSLFSLYEKESVEAIIDEMNKLYKNTGLKVNFDKSTIYPIGAVMFNRKRLYLSQKFKWSKGPIDYAGHPS